MFRVIHGRNIQGTSSTRDEVTDFHLSKENYVILGLIGLVFVLNIESPESAMNSPSRADRRPMSLR